MEKLLQKQKSILESLKRAEKQADQKQVRDLELIMMNDEVFVSMLNSLIEYKDKKDQKRSFNETLFFQLIKNTIDSALNTDLMKNTYRYNKSTVNVPTRWAVAQELYYYIRECTLL